MRMKFLFLCSLLLVFVLSNCGTETTTTTSASTTLTAVAEDMVPDSLAYTSASSASVNDAQSDPCAEYHAEYGAATLAVCQPKLLRMYLEIAKDIIEHTNEAVTQTGSHLGDLPDGATGTATHGNQTISYSKTDANNYSILIKVNGSSAMYLNVAGSVIIVKITFDAMGVTDSPGGNTEATVTYTDENNYSITATMSDMTCSDTDVNAPQNMKLIVNKVSGLWTGYSMLYQPRWGGSHLNLTCSTTPTAETSVMMYSNFVGNDTAAKVNVYMTRRDIDNTEFDNNLSDYGINDMCTKYPTILGSNYCDSVNLSSFVNSFCNPASTLTATWDDNCSSVDSPVASGTFPTDDWVRPLTFYEIGSSFSIPSSL